MVTAGFKYSWKKMEVVAQDKSWVDRNGLRPCSTTESKKNKSSQSTKRFISTTLPNMYCTGLASALFVKNKSVKASTYKPT